MTSTSSGPRVPGAKQVNTNLEQGRGARPLVRRGFRAFAGLLSSTFILQPHIAAPEAQQITTQGDCSPVIAGVSGDVKANINCYNRLLAPAPITLHTIETILQKERAASAPLFFRPE